MVVAQTEEDNHRRQTSVFEYKDCCENQQMQMG